MAQPAKKRRIKQAQTVRQKIDTPKKVDQVKKRRLQTGAKKVVRPLRVFRFLRFLVPRYFKNSWLELKQVTWPTRKETWQLTLAVFMFAGIFGVLVAVTDFGLDKIFERILLNL